VLITGGAGTLGRAIVRRAEKEGWQTRFTIYSRSELLQSQMMQEFPDERYILGDIADAERLSAAIMGHDVVIHAAAAKRIPEAEQQPWQCYQTNVVGSQNVIRACLQARVVRCIGVSTDKACHAITAYGASKLMMEALFKAQTDPRTVFTLVRYGNVVASRGSVIPKWRRQAFDHIPITITDKRCTRFWMAESQAVDTILEGIRMPAGTITVPLMGSLTLPELAAIVVPGCEIKETGLRSTEKRHEELVHPDEIAVMRNGYYFIHPTAGTLGNTYTSEHAPRITPDAFLAMLKEAESHE